MKRCARNWSISLVSEKKKKVTVLMSVTRSDTVENRYAWTSFSQTVHLSRHQMQTLIQTSDACLQFSCVLPFTLNVPHDGLDHL